MNRHKKVLMKLGKFEPYPWIISIFWLWYSFVKCHHWGKMSKDITSYMNIIYCIWIYNFLKIKSFLFKKLNIRLLCDTAISWLVFILKQCKHMSTQKCIPTIIVNVYSGFIFKSQTLKTTQMSINKWMINKNVICLCNEIPLKQKT